MLHIIQDIADRFYRFLTEDPVRPNIPTEHRVGVNRDIFVLHEQDTVDAITCVSYTPQVPKTESELFHTDSPSVAVFYTIWSYRPGAGRELILDSVSRIRQDHPEIQRFVTLSPKTEMARKFHLKNGARVLQENSDTINYEYVVDKVA